jgi:hypothetical protein
MFQPVEAGNYYVCLSDNGGVSYTLQTALPSRFNVFSMSLALYACTRAVLPRPC